MWNVISRYTRNGSFYTFILVDFDFNYYLFTLYNVNYVHNDMICALNGEFRLHELYKIRHITYLHGIFQIIYSLSFLAHFFFYLLFRLAQLILCFISFFIYKCILQIFNTESVSSQGKCHAASTWEHAEYVAVATLIVGCSGHWSTSKPFLRILIACSTARSCRMLQVLSQTQMTQLVEFLRATYAPKAHVQSFW